MNAEYEALTPEQKERMNAVKANFLSTCQCEAYFNHECTRCQRLAKQGGGDALLGELVTGGILFQLGLITDEKYAPPPTLET